MLLTSTGDNLRLCSEGVLLFSFSGDQALGFVDLWAYLGLSSVKIPADPSHLICKRSRDSGVCVFSMVCLSLLAYRESRRKATMFGLPQF